MSTLDDITEVREAEESRGRRYVAQGLTVAPPPPREREPLVTHQIKVQRFGGLITRLGEAIEGVPVEDARAALQIVLLRLPALAPAPVVEAVVAPPKRTPRPRAPAATPRRAPASPPRTIHASGQGQAAETLRRALQALGGRATTRQLATRVGKSVSTVTHTLRAMGIHRPERGVWVLES